MSALSLDLFWTIPAGVFIAGFISSPHCIAMCGPLAFSLAQSRRSYVLYQFGRMISYTMMGALAGWLGESLLKSLRTPEVSIAALAILSIVLFLMAYRAYRATEVQHLSMPRFVSKMTSQLFRNLRRLPKDLNAVAGGGLTVLLPCGHLYGFVLGAAATGSVVAGSFFMFAFWLSQIPALTLSPIFARSVLKRRLTAAPKIAGIILLCTGLISIASFARNVAKLEQQAAVSETASSGHSCH